MCIQRALIIILWEGWRRDCKDFAIRKKIVTPLPQNVHEVMVLRVIPTNTKHLYNIYTTSAQRLRRWTNIV